jgi:hypothetical protein
LLQNLLVKVLVKLILHLRKLHQVMAKEMLKRKDGSYPREVSGITSVLLKVLERNLLKLC